MAAFFGADEIWSRHDGKELEKVVLAGVFETQGQGDSYSSEEEFLHSLEELRELSKACMMDPVYTVTQHLPRASAALYMGSGKAEELRSLAEYSDARRVIFNDTLSPSQIRNLQKLLRLPVMDRTALILEIFERRARTREARLQVELAKLRYLKPRLIGMWETQNRQGGASGAQSARGEGEKQLELDRRTIDHRLSELSREIREVSRERETRRRKRQGSGLPLVALVGYTNAGKSTIMNGLLERYVIRDGVNETEKRQDGTIKRKVFEADMLFATLDTTVRRIRVEQGREFLLSDTVGFIHKLPASLVEAFRSTLEEVTEADLLLQIVDGSDPFCREHTEVTKKVISELGAGGIPMLTVFNKADLVDPPQPYPRRGLREEGAGDFSNENLYLSAKDPLSLEFLVEAVFRRLESDTLVRDFLIPYDRGSLVSFLRENAVVEGTEYTETGTLLTVRCQKAVADRMEKELGPISGCTNLPNPV